MSGLLGGTLFDTLVEISPADPAAEYSFTCGGLL